MRKIMNRYKIFMKHAARKATAALRLLFLPALLLSTAMNAQAAKETPAEAENIVAEAPAETISVTMVGDSVMLGAAPSIQEALPDCVIDAKVSRQITQADDVLDSLEQQNTLHQTVVIALGTNGPFGTDVGQELIDRLGNDRTVYWVTVYGSELSWQEDSNTTIRELADANENVHIIDWAQTASGHTEWFYSDGIHLNAEGREAYTQMVLTALSPGQT